VGHKTVIQFRFILILGLVILTYISNLIYIKLPFFSASFSEKDISQGLLSFYLSFFPHIKVEFQMYNLQVITIWAYSIIFGPIFSTTSILIYLFLGFIGLPIFAGGGGLNYFNEPTFGYLISLPLLAYLSGYIYKKNSRLLSVFLPIVGVHLIGIFYLFIFKQEYINLAWYMSFSMIGYDILFGFLLLPIMPFMSFILHEMFIQEIPTIDHDGTDKQFTKTFSRFKKQIV